MVRISDPRLSLDAPDCHYYYLGTRQAVASLGGSVVGLCEVFAEAYYLMEPVTRNSHDSNLGDAVLGFVNYHSSNGLAQEPGGQVADFADAA